jgi:DNA-binding NarL/FixJ family response regulator
MPRAAPIESVRLLIIEDDPVDVELIRALLGKSERLKALVAHADRLSVGLGLLEKGGVDLLLLDLGLPDSYGLETFNELHGRFTNVPVIILSGLDDEDTATLAVSKGAQDYLVKGSINTDVLVRSIRYAIQRHEINMIASRNIAQRERAEEALIQLNRELEQRVETEVADRMQKERLLLHQSRMAAMGEVVNAVAHQWRQPLSVISLTAQDIKDAYRHGELDADYIKNAIGGIIDQVGFMSATIDDFRNFLKPAGAVTMFDVKEAIENIISMFSLIFKKNDIAISFNIMDKDGGAAPCVNGGAAVA